MSAQPNFRISPANPTVLTDLFLPIFANFFLIISVLIIKVSTELANYISGKIRSQQKTEP